MILLWTTRNEESARREVLHKELQELYLWKQDYPLRVQHLLHHGSYEIHTQETVTKIADWLDAYKGTFAVTWSPNW
jgi:hypothetical protein